MSLEDLIEHKKGLVKQIRTKRATSGEVDKNLVNRLGEVILTIHRKSGRR